jgi:hypothetical protein
MKLQLWAFDKRVNDVALNWDRPAEARAAKSYFQRSANDQILLTVDRLFHKRFDFYMF